MLGGQHGEEEKVQDQVSGEEGCEEDEASEEEVALVAKQSSTSNDVDDCVTRAGDVERLSATLMFDSAGSGRQQRASARQGA